MLLEACSSLFATLVEFVVARSTTTTSMDSAVASSSALGLMLAAMLAMEAMVLSAAFLTLLFVASVQMQFLATDGV